MTQKENRPPNSDTPLTESSPHSLAHTPERSTRESAEMISSQAMALHTTAPSESLLQDSVRTNGEDLVHLDKACDGCKKENFSGIRYHCTTCQNYDLCQWCNDASIVTPPHSRFHEMMEAIQPTGVQPLVEDTAHPPNEIKVVEVTPPPEPSSSPVLHAALDSTVTPPEKELKKFHCFCKVHEAHDIMDWRHSECRDFISGYCLYCERGHRSINSTLK